MALQQVFMEPVTAQTQTKTTGLDLGTLRYEGSKIYQYIYNSGGAAIAADYGCRLSGTGGYSATVTSTVNEHIAFGIAESAISATAYGWVLKKGITTFIAEANTSFAVGERLVLGTDGAFYSGSGISAIVYSALVCGECLSAMATAAGSALGYFNFMRS